MGMITITTSDDQLILKSTPSAHGQINTTYFRLIAAPVFMFDSTPGHRCLMSRSVVCGGTAGICR
jgi:hypothetical protein